VEECPKYKAFECNAIEFRQVFFDITQNYQKWKVLKDSTENCINTSGIFRINVDNNKFFVSWCINKKNEALECQVKYPLDVQSACIVDGLRKKGVFKQNFGNDFPSVLKVDEHKKIVELDFRLMDKQLKGEVAKSVFRRKCFIYNNAQKEFEGKKYYDVCRVAIECQKREKLRGL